jgi:hypothetical protein
MMKRLLLVAVSAAVFTLMTGCSTQHKTMAWEYRVVHGVPYRTEFEQKLNEAGREGFVIQSSTAIAPVAGVTEAMVILKRPAR